MNFDLEELSDDRRRIVAALYDGNPEPLAKHLETGGELYDDQRAALIKHLRGEIHFNRGNRRTFAQKERERAVCRRIRLLQTHYAIQDGSRASLRKAMDHYQNDDPSISLETLKAYLKRNGGGVSKRQLREIDEIRTEWFAEKAAAEGTGE